MYVYIYKYIPCMVDLLPIKVRRIEKVTATSLSGSSNAPFTDRLSVRGSPLRAVRWKSQGFMGVEASIKSSKHWIVHDVWWYLMMFDDVWWCLMRFNDVWWCLIIFKKCLMMFNDVRWCLMMFNDVWWCLLTFIEVYWVLMMSNEVQWCLMMFIDV